VPERSPIHYGLYGSTSSTTKDKKVIGHYWTDRDSAGEIELEATRREEVRDG
jgi:hypothetical protein